MTEDPFGNAWAAKVLIRKRKEIANKIHLGQYELRKAITDLDAVDKAIKQYDPTSKRKPVVQPSRAFCGQVRLILLRQLNASPRPLTTRQLALGVLRERGLPNGDLKLVRQFIQKTHLALHAMLRQGEAERVKDGEVFTWRLPIKPDDDPGEAA